MVNCISSSFVLAQAIPPETSLAGWMLSSLGSLSSLLVLLSGLLIFGGACFLVATKRRPAVLAAYLVLLPLPVLIDFSGLLYGMIRSLTVVAASPGLSLPTEEVAGGVAASLMELLFAILISAPSYFVLAYGLLVRTLNLPSESPRPTPIRSEVQKPLLSSGGSLPVTT